MNASESFLLQFRFAVFSRVAFVNFLGGTSADQMELNFSAPADAIGINDESKHNRKKRRMQTHDDLPHLNTAQPVNSSAWPTRGQKNYIPLANSKIARELLILAVLRTMTAAFLAFAHKHAEGLFLFNSP
jgi:hypothetical protein